MAVVGGLTFKEGQDQGIETTTDSKEVEIETKIIGEEVEEMIEEAIEGVIEGVIGVEVIETTERAVITGTEDELLN